MHKAIKGINRWLVKAAGLVLSEEKARRLERLRRGREEFRKLQRADYVFISFGKSGRTWLRVMLSRYYQLSYDLPEHSIMGFDNYHLMNSAAPAILFTHGNYIRDYTDNYETKCEFYDKKLILLVRRPQDVAVSQYFQWKYRMRPAKKTLNGYPAHGEDVTLYDFVMNRQVGLAAIVAYLNGWASELAHIREHLLVRYEDVHARPADNLKRIVAFLGMTPDPARVGEAVRFASVENLRDMERKDFFRRSGVRMMPRDRNDPNTYKVRRAKVGGYRDYFDHEQLTQIDALVASSLSPVFGYGDRDTARSFDAALRERVAT